MISAIVPVPLPAHGRETPRRVILRARRPAGEPLVHRIAGGADADPETARRRLAPPSCCRRLVLEQEAGG
ncbi:MAG: hypothetical protein U5L11_11355 [Arhodomonas sp.]|nr:hypothetical protein [Arhodomonas sp.]